MNRYVIVNSREDQIVVENWREEHDKHRPKTFLDGSTLVEFTVLNVNPKEVIIPIHHRKKPTILSF